MREALGEENSLAFVKPTVQGEEFEERNKIKRKLSQEVVCKADNKSSNF